MSSGWPRRRTGSILAAIGESRSPRNPDTEVRFTIGEEQVRLRKRRAALGFFFAACLTAVILVLNRRDPRSYNEVLTWSVVGFLGVFSIVFFFRHLRYLRLARDHWLEISDGRLRFHTRGSDTELDLRDDVAAVRHFRHRQQLRHLQIILKNNRGIRLESYDDLEGLAKALADQMEPANPAEDSASPGDGAQDPTHPVKGN